MKAPQRLQVEVYAHGGWWKDADGRTGQVPEALANRSPLATVASLANRFGLEGWRLTDLVSGRHNTYIVTFERAPQAVPMTEVGSPHAKAGVAAPAASITLG